MFIGELLCLVAYGVKELFKWRQRRRELVLMVDTAEEYKQGSIPTKRKINPFLLAIPASFDIIASTMMNIALTMVAASVYQMLRGMKVLVTAVLSIIFLKKKLYRHHWTSIAVIFIGLVLVGIAVLTG